MSETLGRDDVIKQYLLCSFYLIPGFSTFLNMNGKFKRNN